jgi:cation/acetate symporter
MLPNTADNWLFGISPLAFGTVGAVLNFAAAYIVSGMTEETPQEIKDLVDSVRIPRGAGGAIDH